MQILAYGINSRLPSLVEFTDDELVVYNHYQRLFERTDDITLSAKCALKSWAVRKGGLDPHDDAFIAYLSDGTLKRWGGRVRACTPTPLAERTDDPEKRLVDAFFDYRDLGYGQMEAAKHALALAPECDHPVLPITADLATRCGACDQLRPYAYKGWTLTPEFVSWLSGGTLVLERGRIRRTPKGGE